MKAPREDDEGWQCPECGRHFVRRTREHSCLITGLEYLMRSCLPAVHDTFAALKVALDALGPYDLIPLKSMVTLSVRTTFGGITFGKSWLDLGIVLARSLEHPRVRWSQRLSPKTFVYRVRLSSPGDVDDEVETWLREAYQVGLMGGRRSGSDKASP